MKLVMTILVKNEEDIIENNIRFHAAQGVDAFLVMDNNSDDQTPDILRRLQKEFDVIVVRNTSMEYQQSQWMTALARQAGKEMAADLVINNDADEFWSTTDGSPLKSKLSMKDSVVTVRRYNYILDELTANQLDGYVLCRNKVITPVLYDVSNVLSDNNLTIPLQRISPKVIVRPRGLRQVKGGNHRANHLFFWQKRQSDEIVVEHYPIRSYQQFEKNILNRQAIVNKHPERKMNTHYRRWLKALADGQLVQEYRRMVLDDNQKNVLTGVGVIVDSTSALARWYMSLNGK